MDVEKIVISLECFAAGGVYGEIFLGTGKYFRFGLGRPVHSARSVWIKSGQGYSEIRELGARAM